MPRPNNPKPPGILRDVPSHMFAGWNAHAIPPNDVPVGSPPREFIWIASEDPQLVTIPVSQASTVQAAPHAPVAGPAHPRARVDRGTQESNSANPIRRSRRQLTRGAAPIHIPPPNIFVDDAPITTTDYGFPSPSPCALPAAASYSRHAPSPHAPRFHPYLPPSHRRPSQQATWPEETPVSPGDIYEADTPRYASGGNDDVPRQGMMHDLEPEVCSTSYHDPDSGLYPRFSVDPATGAYYWAGTMNLAALDEPAVRRVPSRYCSTDIPMPVDCLPHGQQPAPPFQFPPFAYPPAFPHEVPPFFGQNGNGVAGPAQPYLQEEDDVVMGYDQQDVYQQEQGYANPYPHWGIPEYQDGWNATLLHDSAVSPSASHEPLAADPQAGLFNAPLLPGFPAPDGWPFQPQDGTSEPPQGYREQYQY